MKKLYFVLLSLFFVAHGSFIYSVQEQRMQYMQELAKKQIEAAKEAIKSKFSVEDRKRFEELDAKIKAGKASEIIGNDAKFVNEYYDELREKTTMIIAKIAKTLALEEQKQAKDQLEKFRSTPQGPCPYTEKDKPFVDMIENVIALSEEVTFYDRNHRDLETFVACNDTEYEANSIATSPYHALLPSLDGTMRSLSQNGKNISTTKATEPENEFEIEVARSMEDENQYDFTITAYNTCNTELDILSKPAHRNLAICLYKNIGRKTTQEIPAPAIQGFVEGTRYPAGWISTVQWLGSYCPSWMTSCCADGQAKFSCNKETLAYIIKKRNAQKAGVTNQTPSRPTDMQKLQQDQTQKAN